MNVRSVLFLSAALLFSPLLSTSSALADDHDEYEMTEDQITKVQTLLVEWGLTMKETREDTFYIPNGRLGPKTQEAIAKAQKIWGDRETGYLTKTQYKKLIDGGMPTDYTWGALSVARDGAYGIASDYSSGIEAYRDAQEECRRKTNDPCDGAIAVFQTPKSGERFIAAVWCENDNGGRGYASGGGKSSSDALERVHGLLFESNWHRSQCKEKVVMSVEDGEE